MVIAVVSIRPKAKAFGFAKEPLIPCHRIYPIHLPVIIGVDHAWRVGFLGLSDSGLNVFMHIQKSVF